MKKLLAIALCLASAHGLGAATFAMLPDPAQPVGQQNLESYVFSTTSSTLTSEIRNRIANKQSATPMVRIAPGADGVNRNHVASGVPLWNWHVVEVLSLDVIETTEVGPKPWRDTSLSQINADVQGFINLVGDTISPRYLTRIVEIDPEKVGCVVNVSNRGVLGSGDKILICGFIVQGTTPRLVLVRALGPTLTGFGVTGAAENPALKLFRDSSVIAENDDWETTPSPKLIPPGIEPGNPKEAAIVVVLEPGAYTAHGSSPDEGVGLIDVFDLSGLR